MKNSTDAFHKLIATKQVRVCMHMCCRVKAMRKSASPIRIDILIHHTYTHIITILNVFMETYTHVLHTCTTYYYFALPTDTVLLHAYYFYYRFVYGYIHVCTHTSHRYANVHAVHECHGKCREGQKGETGVTGNDVSQL